jgi:hypothetical protein
MNSYDNMVTYNQWSYVTMPGILEMVFMALREGMPIDRLLFGGSPEESAILQENCPLTACLQMEGTRPGFLFRYQGSRNKTNRPTNAYV